MAKPSSAAAEVDVEYLRFRVESLCRLGRVDEALRVGQTAQLAAAPGYGAASTALLGAVFAVSDDPRRSEPALRTAIESATTAAGREQPAISLARTLFMRGRLNEAESLLQRIAERDSVAYVRRLDVEAWIAYHRCDFARSRSLFDAALERLDRIPHDQQLEFKIFNAICDFAVETLAVDEWVALEARVAPLGPVPSVFWYHFFCRHWFRSIACELMGHPNAALASANTLLTHELPPAYHILTMCRRATILRNYGERLAFRDAAAGVRDAFSAAMRTPLEPVEVRLYVDVAITCAGAGDVATAMQALEEEARHRACSDGWNQSPVLAAQRRYAEAAVADARGYALEAMHGYRAAFAAFRDVGWHRWAVDVGLRLLEMQNIDSIARYVDEHARKLGAKSWVRKRLAPLISQDAPGTPPGLSRAQRDILHLLLAGHSTAEIASRRRRSQKTVRNAISSLLKAFGVETRQQLMYECSRRGIM